MTNGTPAPVVTPEQLQILLRLEEIFMPQAKRQRDEAYRRRAGQEELRFVHYTSAEAALRIIKSKRLWMRNTTCMTDYREVQHGFRILNNFFADAPKMDTFVKAVDDCVPGAGKEAIELFNRWWRDIQFNTFVTSVSEHYDNEDAHGRLSMWRAFGLSTTARVAIVFSVPKFSPGALALRLIFSPVAYLPEPKVHAVIQEVIQNLSPNREFLRSIDRVHVVEVLFNMLLAGVTCLKHEGFQEEREWRAIYCPSFYPSALMQHAIEVVGGVPQLVYKIPLDVSASPDLADLDFSRRFNRLIIGPSAYPWAMYEAFREALVEAGVLDGPERIQASEIPIRTA